MRPFSHGLGVMTSHLPICVVNAMMILLMSGARSGVKSVVQEVSHKALHYHCAAHRLNLAVVPSCKIQAFKNAKSYIGEIVKFFNFSIKR